MLKSISIKNYKAFKEEKTFNISNINILLWKNSVWKSSVLEVFLLLSQTLSNINNSKNNLKSNLVLNWKTLKLWTNNDFIYSDWNTKEKSFKISFSFESDLFKSFFYSFYRTLSMRLRRELPLKKELKTDIKNLKDSNIINKILKELPKIDNKLIQNFYITDSKDQIQEYSDLLNIAKYFNKFNQKNINNVSIEILFINKNNEMVIDTFTIWDFLKISLKSDGYVINWKSIYFWWKKIVFNKILPDLELIERKLRREIWYTFNKNGVLRNFFNKLNEEIVSIFNTDNIKSITPLRANPQRNYVLEDLYSFSSDSWESLIQELLDDDIFEFVNSKFKEYFWLEIYIDWDKNSVLKNLKIKQYNWYRNIADVWFWISQILPIIVQSMIAKEWSILLIQQPEIHLHPSMQSRLADLFIDIINKKNLYLIIETHSEYFLNRLKLKLLQTKNESIKTWRITKDKINIYFFHENLKKNFTNIKKVNITPYWSFEFPKWFKDEEIDDVFLYMNELLKFKWIEKINQNNLYNKE